MDLEWATSRDSRTKAYCRFCELETLQVPTFTVTKDPAPDRWCQCTCGTLNSMDLTRAPDYSEIEGDDVFFMRLDQADSADGVIGPVARFLPNAPMPFVDVGCGLGFAADYMKWKGIDSRGIDPSNSARLATQRLGMPIDESLTPGDATEASEDCYVLLSEVIEHVDSPRSLLATLAQTAGPQGVLLVTTPDADALTRNARKANALAAIGSGQHLFLLGEHQLREMLVQTGFSAVESWTDAGRLFAVASRYAIPHPGAFRRKEYQSYLQARVDGRFHTGAGEPDLVVRAFGSRLYKELVNSGKYRSANRAFETLVEVFSRLDLDLTDPEGLVDRYSVRIDARLGIPNPESAPMSAPMLCFLRAIQGANHEKSPKVIDGYLEAAEGLAALYVHGSVFQSVDLEVASLSDLVARARSRFGFDSPIGRRFWRVQVGLRRMVRWTRGISPRS